MALFRVDHTALMAVASRMQQTPQRLATAFQEITSARGLSGGVGDPTAAADTDELLRQLAVLVDLEGQGTTALARTLVAATADYAMADDVVVRFEG